jgi:hypothetical protein
MECPGCGLTRSMIHLAHGNIHQSLADHRLGWLIALAILAQFPYRLVLLRSERAAFLSERNASRVGKLLIALLVLNWLLGVPAESS